MELWTLAVLEAYWHVDKLLEIFYGVWKELVCTVWTFSFMFGILGRLLGLKS